MHTTANITAKIRFMIKFLTLINVAHPLEIVPQAVNESASSTKCARVHEASAFDRNGNTSTAISTDEKLRTVNTTPGFGASRAPRRLIGTTCTTVSANAKLYRP